MNLNFKNLAVAFFAITITLFSSCTSTHETSPRSQAILKMKRATDHHSYSKPEVAVVKHLDWSAIVDFDSRIISATASYDINTSNTADEIIFDIRELDIESITVDGVKSTFTIGEEQEFIGSPLKISITPDAKKVSISYKTQPGADAFLWVEGENPFLFTQSQAILARTWIPCQDSPGIRFTYNASVDVPKGLMALMSAVNPTTKTDDGHYDFVMDQPIPSYLLALAVGDVEFRSVGEHTGVYATPDLIDAAEYEFAEMEDLLVAAESLYGKYAWERYDLLVLPAAFPFGGMENPRLTFATPTIIAGDRSLVSLVAHELAHSWSGNLVTNSTWDDFWLNEGFTVYFEQRIMESVYGRDISEMLASLSYRGLVNEVSVIMDLNPNDTHLRLHLQGRNPDDGMTAIAYDKGYLFLRMIEETVGRSEFDSFIAEYFSKHAFTVMDTDNFIEYLEDNLLQDATIREKVNLTAWIDGAGLPDNCPVIQSDRITAVDEAVAQWSEGELSTDDLAWENWLYQERYRFMKNIPESVSVAKLDELNKTFSISSTGNNEVLFAWLEQAILKHHTESYPRLETFLVNVGRRKFLTPLYKAMLDTDQTEMAHNIYSLARPNYHSVATGTMDELLGVNP
ncbi:MAG TPA: M1 family peptidase [Flavobacteriales bacterium]|nr:M1 family peptidase [Flavobacteriales bacterium]HIO15935.1 M1 family peptidase [Flavobacteriales bacterium]